MLPKIYRLNLKSERFSRGEKEFTCTFFKLIVKSQRSDKPKVGFIVSGKVGKAAQRNRVRRIFSEVAAKKLGRIPRDLALIFIAFPGSSKAKYEEIDSSFDKALSKLFNAEI